MFSKLLSIFARPRRTRTTVNYIPDELPPNRIMPLYEEIVIYTPFDVWIKMLEANPTAVMRDKPAGWLAYIRVEDEKYYVLKDAWKVVNSKIVEGPKRKECLLYSHEIVAATISAPELTAGGAHA